MDKGTGQATLHRVAKSRTQLKRCTTQARTAAAAAAKLLQSCPTLCNPIDGNPLSLSLYPLSLGFSRQERWSGLPFPSPVHESEK